MSYIIRSDKFLAICLLAVGGDVNVPLGELFDAVRKLQDAAGDHFGVSETDFMGGLARLAIEERLFAIEFDKPWDYDTKLEAVPLSRLAGPMLKRSYVYFNDEGESWETDNEEAGVGFGDKLAAFLGLPDGEKPAKVIAYLAGIGWTGNEIPRYMSMGDLKE